MTIPLTLNEIRNRFPDWVGEIYNSKLPVYKPSGYPIGCLYQDKTRCIYESYSFDGAINVIENAEFLSNFKHKCLLVTKITSYVRHIYVLQEIL